MVNPSDVGNADQFSLRWNNFHSNLSSGFHDLLEEEDLVDVTLACEGQFVQAHKIVLSVCSPYFKALFKANPCKHPIVILKDVRHRDLMSIIQFMYLGEVNVRQDELTYFLKTAETLKVKGLTEDDKAKNSSKEPSALEEPPDKPQATPQQGSSSKQTTSSDSSPVPPTKRFRRDLSASSGPPVPSAPAPTSLSSAANQTRPPQVESPGALSGDSSMDFIGGVGSVGGGGNNSVSKPPKTEPLEQEEEEDGEEEEGEEGGTGDEYKNLIQEVGGGSGGEEMMVHSMDLGQAVVVGECRSVPGMGPSGGGGGNAAVSQPPPLTPGMVVSSSGVSIFPSSSGSSQEAISQDYGHGSSLQLPSRFSCPVCGKEFTRKDNLKTHFENLHGKARGPVRCPICQKVTKNRNSLRAHLYEYHRRNLSETKREFSV